MPEFGGTGRNRTDDLLYAKQLLSRLSYGPKMIVIPVTAWLPHPIRQMVSHRS